MKPSVWYVYCEKNIWFRTSGTFFEQVIKYSVSYHGTEWQCQWLSGLYLSDFYQVVFPDSLDRYLSAEFKRLKECSLSIEHFPIGKGVFDI